MDLGLKNKRVFISGSTSGIGYATARKFIEEGAEVLINGRTKESTEAAAEKLLNEYPSGVIEVHPADFRLASEVSNLIEKLVGVDILVNNVGIYSSQSFEETEDQDWFDMFTVNVMSGVRLSRALLPQMISKNWGRIVFISSECAQIVPSDLIAYSATKASIHAVSRGLAQRCKSTNVTVNTMMPGSTLTEGAEDFLEGVAKAQGISVEAAASNFFKEIRTSSLVERFLSPDEIADGIVYLCSKKSSAINGSSIKLEGGSVGGIF